MPATDLLPLGTRVLFDQADVLTRDYVALTDADRARYRYRSERGMPRAKAWSSIRERMPGQRWYLRQRRGVIVGARSLANGLTEYEPEYGTVFMARERVPVYLVATGLHDRIVRLRRDAVKPEASQSALEVDRG